MMIESGRSVATWPSVIEKGFCFLSLVEVFVPLVLSCALFLVYLVSLSGLGWSFFLLNQNGHREQASPKTP